MSTAAIAPTTTTGNVERALLVQGFLVALDSEGRSPATARLYSYGLQRLFGVLDGLGLGGVPLAQLTREHLEHALAELRREGLSPSTRQAVHRAMRAFWRWALEEGEIRENVAARVKAPAGEEKVVDVLTDEQTGALFRSLRRDSTLLGLRDLTAITILSDTGLRASELLGLTVEAIDMQQRRAIILGKGARERVIGLEPGTLRLLRRYWRRAGITEGAILRSRTGRPLPLRRQAGHQAGCETAASVCQTLPRSKTALRDRRTNEGADPAAAVQVSVPLANKRPQQPSRELQDGERVEAVDHAIAVHVA